MMKKIFVFFISMVFCYSGNIFEQQKMSFVNTSTKPTNFIEIGFKQDSLKDKDESIAFQYIGDNKNESEISVTLDEGILKSGIIKFRPFSVKLISSAVISVPFSISKGFKYDDIVGKAIFFKIKSDKAAILEGGESTIQVTFSKKIETKKEETKKDETIVIDDFFRLNIGTSFDYLSSSPLKLLYVDANVMNPHIFAIKPPFIKTIAKFGFYGRLYQFQGVSQVADRERDALFFSEPIGGGISGKDTILRKLPNDSLIIKRPYYNRQAELIEKKTYGMAAGFTTPIVYSSSRNFYLSIGIHFEGMLTQYDRKNTYTKIFVDSLKISKKDFLNRPQQEPNPLSRRVNYTGMLGISCPIIWRFTDFELKVLPALSIINFDDSQESGTKRSYSVHAVLTEIKQTGLNIGAEIRGYSGVTPATFSIFIAKTFNMKKFGDFLKL